MQEEHTRLQSLFSGDLSVWAFACSCYFFDLYEVMRLKNMIELLGTFGFFQQHLHRHACKDKQSCTGSWPLSIACVVRLFVPHGLNDEDTNSSSVAFLDDWLSPFAGRLCPKPWRSDAKWNSLCGVSYALASFESITNGELPWDEYPGILAPGMTVTFSHKQLPKKSLENDNIKHICTVNTELYNKSVFSIRSLGQAHSVILRGMMREVQELPRQAPHTIDTSFFGTFTWTIYIYVLLLLIVYHIQHKHEISDRYYHIQ